MVSNGSFRYNFHQMKEIRAKYFYSKDINQ